MSLSSVLLELQEHKNDSSREEIFTKYVRKRLDDSLDTYYKELDLSVHGSFIRNEVRVLKDLKKN